jgi:hypothetical protein
MFITAFNQRGADLGDERVGAQQACGYSFERPELPPAED